MTLFDKIRTPSQLKGFVQNGTDSHFFDRSSMKFFGDTMRNYGVRHVTIERRDGEVAKAVELYRRMPVKGRLQNSAYFMASDIDSARRVFGQELNR